MRSRRPYSPPLSALFRPGQECLDFKSAVLARRLQAHYCAAILSTYLLSFHRIIDFEPGPARRISPSYYARRDWLCKSHEDAWPFHCYAADFDKSHHRPLLEIGPSVFVSCSPISHDFCTPNLYPIFIFYTSVSQPPGFL